MTIAEAIEILRNLLKFSKTLSGADREIVLYTKDHEAIELAIKELEMR